MNKITHFMATASIALLSISAATFASADPDNIVRGFANGSGAFAGGTTRNGSDFGVVTSRGDSATSTSATSANGANGRARVSGFYTQETGGVALDLFGRNTNVALDSNSSGNVGGEAVVELNGARATDDAAYADGLSRGSMTGSASGVASRTGGTTVATNRGTIDARANLNGNNNDRANSRSYGAAANAGTATDSRTASVSGTATSGADALTSEVESDQVAAPQPQ